MKLFTPYALFISLGLALLSASAVSGATHLDQVQPPGVYPHDTYTASYAWTQTTVDESINNSHSSTQCKIVSSDGKGHLVCKSLDSSESIEILDLLTGKLYQRSKYSQPVAKNSVTSYSSFSYLNEVMFTHDADVFNDVTGMAPNPAPKSIGSKLIKGYQCEGWRLITDYKIDEWWFEKQSKCLVLMESKPNPNPSPSMNRLIFWLMGIFFGGPGSRTTTITERLDSFSKDPLAPSYFNTKDLSPIKLTVWKMVENEPVSNKKFQPDIDLDKVYRESPPPSEVVKLPPAGQGWKRVDWHATRGYGSGLSFLKDNFFGREFFYALDLPDDWSLTYGEGTGLIYGNPKKGAEMMLHYWGTTAFRKCHHWNRSEDDAPYVMHGFAWTDARQEAEDQMKHYCKYEIQTNHTRKLLSTKITPQITHGGISFWRADARYREDNVIVHGEFDHCNMVSDEGINLSFESTPVTEKIVESLCRK